jgi:hypothetical protein
MLIEYLQIRLERIVMRPRLLLFVSTRFQILFHRPSGLLFTFPSWY